MQYSLFTQEPASITVSDLTRYIRQMFELDYRLQDVWVQGEISNLSRPSSGHVYFTLKDSGAAIKCAMWRASVTPNVQRLREGDAILAHGKISVYEVQGAYQLYVDAIQTAGVGDLFSSLSYSRRNCKPKGFLNPIGNARSRRLFTPSAWLPRPRARPCRTCSTSQSTLAAVARGPVTDARAGR